MLNFFLSFVIFAATTFLLALSVRYGMYGAVRLDSWISTRTGRNSDGFDWYFRIPTSAGVIPEYFFAIVLGWENYFRTNWWALKSSSFVAVLLFVPLLMSRSVVADYYSLGLIEDQGFNALFTSGTLVWYLNIITTLFIGLCVLITVESVRVAGAYAPIRVILFLLLSVLMAGLTVAILAVIVFVTVIYFAWKVIELVLLSNRSGKGNLKDDESAGDILRKGLSGFKMDLDEWLADRRQRRSEEKKLQLCEETKKRRSKDKKKRQCAEKSPQTRGKTTIRPDRNITNRSMYDDIDIPRLHPDQTEE